MQAKSVVQILEAIVVQPDKDRWKTFQHRVLSRGIVKHGGKCMSADGLEMHLTAV
jgi:hypothetical protein